MKERVETLQGYLISESRTTKLWVQYMSYSDVIKTFIRFERTGNWDEHLAATKKMLNLYADTGHFNYGKITRLYLLRLEYHFLGHIDNLKKMDFIVFGAQTNTRQGIGQISR